MRNYATFLAILIVTVPTLALAQTTTPSVPGSAEPSPTAVQSAGDADNTQNPAVILKPIQPGSKFDMALIDDVCVHTKRRAQVYRLKNAAVEEVADSINQWLKSKLNLKSAQVNGFICNAPVIIVPEIATNSLIVSVAADFKAADELNEMILQLDRTSNTIEIQAVLKKTVDGKTDVLAIPRLIAKENSQCSVTVDTEEGQFTIELTARVIKDDGSRQETLRSAQKETENLKAK
jgi:hypothetical protein